MKPVSVKWDGAAFRPASPGQVCLAEQQFTPGRHYMLRQATMEEISPEISEWVERAWNLLNPADSLKPWAKSPKAMRLHAHALLGFAKRETVRLGNTSSAMRVGDALVESGADVICVPEAGALTIITPYKFGPNEISDPDGFARYRRGMLAVLCDLTGLPPQSITHDQTNQEDAA